MIADHENIVSCSSQRVWLKDDAHTNLPKKQFQQLTGEINSWAEMFLSVADGRYIDRFSVVFYVIWIFLSMFSMFLNGGKRIALEYMTYKTVYFCSGNINVNTSICALYGNLVPEGGTCKQAQVYKSCYRLLNSFSCLLSWHDGRCTFWPHIHRHSRLHRKMIDLSLLS